MMLVFGKLRCFDKRCSEMTIIDVKYNKNAMKCTINIRKDLSTYSVRWTMELHQFVDEPSTTLIKFEDDLVNQSCFAYFFQPSDVDCVCKPCMVLKYVVITLPILSIQATCARTF